MLYSKKKKLLEIILKVSFISEKITYTHFVKLRYFISFFLIPCYVYKYNNSRRADPLNMRGDFKIDIIIIIKCYKRCTYIRYVYN